MNTHRAVVLGSTILVLGLLATQVFSKAPAAAADLRKAAQQHIQDGNYKDAYKVFHSLAIDKDANPREAGSDLHRAIDCLRQLNRVQEIDALLEEVIAKHGGNWRLLEAGAQAYMSLDHYGTMIAGEFQRGQQRGGGKVVSSLERDRVRALQLMVTAMQHTADEPNREEISRFYFRFAGMMLGNRGYNNAWRLQYLTHLDELPDYEPGWPNYGSQTTGAPVGADGKPVYHETAKTWDEAKTDGQRWRFCLDQAVKNRLAMLDQARIERANFLFHQFGVQTMRQYQGSSAVLLRDQITRLAKKRTLAAHTSCTRSARTKRSPGWRPAFADSSCPTSITSSSSTSWS